MRVSILKFSNPYGRVVLQYVDGLYWVTHPGEEGGLVGLSSTSVEVALRWFVKAKNKLKEKA